MAQPLIIQKTKKVRYSEHSGKGSMAEFKYEVVKEIGVLSETGNGWTKEINLVSWNDRSAVYDIRTWSEGKDRMGKGIALTAEAAKVLRDILNGIDL